MPTTVDLTLANAHLIRKVSKAFPSGWTRKSLPLLVRIRRMCPSHLITTSKEVPRISIRVRSASDPSCKMKKKEREEGHDYSIKTKEHRLSTKAKMGLRSYVHQIGGSLGAPVSCIAVLWWMREIRYSRYMENWKLFDKILKGARWWDLISSVSRKSLKDEIHNTNSRYLIQMPKSKHVIFIHPSIP